VLSICFTEELFQHGQQTLAVGACVFPLSCFPLLSLTLSHGKYFETLSFFSIQLASVRTKVGLIPGSKPLRRVLVWIDVFVCMCGECFAIIMEIYENWLWIRASQTAMDAI